MTDAVREARPARRSENLRSLGIQLQPTWTCRDLAELARQLARTFDIAWVPDQPLGRETYVVATAMAMGGMGVATCVTHPLGRDPINTARGLAAVSELVPPDREILLGVSSGGVMPAGIYGRSRPADRVEEMIALVRALWRGDVVALRDFPVLSAAFGYRPEARVQLSFPPSREIPIIVSGIAPRLLDIAGRTADGFLAGSAFPPQSPLALSSRDDPILNGVEQVLSGERARDETAFRLVYQINISVSTDRAAAKALAQQYMTLVLGNAAFWPSLELMGFDLEPCRRIQQVFANGEGVDRAAGLVPTELVDSFVAWGTADECARRVAEIRDVAVGRGFRDFVIGVPTGPDAREAVGLLVDEVVPHVWPERR